MKWEYLIVYSNFKEQEEFNEFGKVGWELVSVIMDDGYSPKAYFKRPLRTRLETEILKHFENPYQENRSSLV